MYLSGDVIKGRNWVVRTNDGLVEVSRIETDAKGSIRFVGYDHPVNPAGWFCDSTYHTEFLHPLQLCCYPWLYREGEATCWSYDGLDFWTSMDGDEAFHLSQFFENSGEPSESFR